eukprot:Gregarina_sp_Pseudo_9__3953@NODE_409_length_2897_cov_306_254724_g386_i0_p2_GENE_NODE_409_length_2897_cov_306_254724_g386_i0NODE_409_length_2897_cov_306_254724_g386_i0_p2_ORF_typecomplete_len190_score7_59TMEM251/PF15190_6/0_069AC_N/PF16214_5/0_99MRAP/PF15183_6/4_3e02MRAP/PF15183_6/1_1Mtp/PF03821_16/3_6DUF2070/PF09843_9/6_1DUF3533/PF12051_8/4_1_NODE_409_length_2897_cov_306_254724_g386_i019212490
MLLFVSADLSLKGCSFIAPTCDDKDPSDIAILGIEALGIVVLLAYVVYHLAVGSPAYRRKGLVMHFCFSWLSILLGTTAIIAANSHIPAALFAVSLTSFAIVTFILIRLFPLHFWDTLCLFVFFYLNLGLVLLTKTSIPPQDYYFIIVPLYLSLGFTWISARGVLGSCLGQCLPTSSMDFQRILRKNNK